MEYIKKVCLVESEAGGFQAGGRTDTEVLRRERDWRAGGQPKASMAGAGDSRRTEGGAEVRERKGSRLCGVLLDSYSE